jgi:hypothetical protein
MHAEFAQQLGYRAFLADRRKRHLRRKRWADPTPLVMPTRS